ncbi:MAG: IS1595 family transposase [Geminicoccaceae bacterium]|nr:IS1595 family transposase [Geminicoccaceae bacterium]
MNVIEIFSSFQTQEQALGYLECVRWHGRPVCPYCGSEHIARHTSSDRSQPRWQCQDCTRAFAVTVGTMFHGTHIPLRDWFIVIALMLNAKKSASACQIARDIGRRRPTVWSMMHRIRAVMEGDMEQARLLHGIVEADETYVGGKPRKGNRRDDDRPAKRGRGTSKLPIVGVVERNGRVAAKPASKGVAGRGLAKFIRKFVDTAGSLLVTDEFTAYNVIGSSMSYARINHAKRYADGDTHTNMIEGFWSLVKRAWYGQHHAHLYILEACYKYNSRNSGNNIDQNIALMVRT